MNFSVMVHATHGLFEAELVGAPMCAPPHPHVLKLSRPSKLHLKTEWSKGNWSRWRSAERGSQGFSANIVTTRRYKTFATRLTRNETPTCENESIRHGLS